jgi:hypothetical protein
LGAHFVFKSHNFGDKSAWKSAAATQDLPVAVYIVCSTATITRRTLCQPVCPDPFKFGKRGGDLDIRQPADPPRKKLTQLRFSLGMPAIPGCDHGAVTQTDNG